MLFRKRMEKSCTYCRFGTMLDDGMALCTKRGVVLTSRTAEHGTGIICRKRVLSILKTSKSST